MNKKINETLYEKFHENGFLIIKNFFNIDEIKYINNEINFYLMKDLSKIKSRDINLVDNKINSIHSLKLSTKLEKFANKKKIKDLSQFFLNERSIVNAIELFAKPARIGLLSPAHQDNAYWCLREPKGLTMWIALTNAGKHNGGLYYYQGSHIKSNLKHVPSYSKGSSQMIPLKMVESLNKNYLKICPELKKGDIIIHHPHVCHGSDENHSYKERKGATIQLFAESYKFDAPMKKKYEKSLLKQINKRLKNG